MTGLTLKTSTSYGILVLLGLLAPGFAPAQAAVSGDTVLSQLNTAISNGATSFTLPNATIQLTKTFLVSSRARNFTLIGQANTKFVRVVNSDFPMIVVGANEPGAYSNTELYRFPQFSVQPASEGTSTLTVPSGVTVPSGWYVIAGIHPTNDLVRISATSAFNHKRELIRVIGQSGTTLTIDRPLGRTFANPLLFQVEPNGVAASLRKVGSDIRLINFAIDGRLGDRVTGRTAVTKSPQVSKAIVAGLTNNLVLESLRISGFSTSGVNVQLSRSATIQNCNIFDGNTRVLGYGIEFTGSRNVVVLNTNFQDMRYGVMFQAGTMDGYVFNCSIPPGRGSFDVGHGQDERRITYDSCRADQFVIGNQGWLRGGETIRLYNCSAYQQIVIYGATRDVQIQGKYPTSPATAPTIQLITDVNPNGFPTGPVWPESVRFVSVSVVNFFWPGKSIQVRSNTGAIPRLGTVRFEGCYLENPKFNGASNVEFGAIANNGIVRFDNSTVVGSNDLLPPLVAFATGTGSWDVTFENSSIVGSAAKAMTLASGSNGIYRFLGSTYNGVPLNPSMITNNAPATASVQITP